VSETQDYWNQRYAEKDRIWSGRPNTALIDSVQELPPGSALDLGCGEGADSIWLAEQGWTVTGVDVSTTAIERAQAAAAGRSLHITWVTADLGSWEPDGAFDLVSACFLHSRVPFARTEVLRRTAAHVAPGGHLLVVGHLEPPPWSRHAHDQEPDAEHGPEAPGFLTPEQQLAALTLGAAWEPLTVEVRERRATGPDGEEAVLRDSVLLVARH